MQAASRVERMPDAFVILFFVILAAAALTWLVPAGYFEVSDQGKLIPESFRYAHNEQGGVPLFDASDKGAGIFNYAFEGLVSGNKWGSAVGVVAFVLIVGGAFGVLMESGAIHNGMLALVKRTQHAGTLLLPVTFVLFSLGGAIFGMGEEAIAFCILLVPLIVGLGYDAITAVLLTYVATQIGFATSWMNPFSVAIAQGIADVPLLSGQNYRIRLWLFFTCVGLIFTLRYANRVKKAPESSVCYASDQYFRAQQSNISGQFNWRDGAILLLLLAAIIWVIWGVSAHQYYIPQIASQFFTLAIAVSCLLVITQQKSMNECSQAFVQGAKDLLPAALIVGMAKGIVLILGGDDVSQASVLNTLLYHASQAIGEAGQVGSALAMLIFQCVFNFFVASGSGQAAITMPLMAPLSDLVGVSRQVAVLAFQLGDGLTNLIIPTSASLVGCLGVTRVDWAVWARAMWKFVALLISLAGGAICLAVFTGFS